MKIQHIRRDGQLIGTLVAIKDDDKQEVRVGFSVVRRGDNPSKKTGVKIASGRAVRRKGNTVPKKIETEFKEFVTHCAELRSFEGCKIPKPEDFEYTFQPIHQHGKTFYDWMQGGF